MTALEAYESIFAYRFKLYIEQHGFSGTGNLVVGKSDLELGRRFRFEVLKFDFSHRVVLWSILGEELRGV